MGKQLIMALTFAVLAGTAVASAAAEIPPKTIAKIGNVTVTELDVQREFQRRLPLQVNFHGGVKPERREQIMAEARETMILRAYKVQYALDNEISVETATVDKEWQARLEKSPKLTQLPAQQKDAERADLYLALLAKKAEEVAVDQKVSVRDDEVRKYYNENKERYFLPRQYKASHIFIKVDPAETAEEKAAKKARADKLYARAIAGEDFYNLAYYESDDRTKYVGGSLGTFHAGQTVKEFDDVLQTMKKGEIRGPVKTIYGYHVIKMDDVQEPRQLTYEEAADKIRRMLFEQRRSQAYEKWLAALKEKYPLQQ